MKPLSGLSCRDRDIQKKARAVIRHYTTHSAMLPAVKSSAKRRLDKHEQFKKCHIVIPCFYEPNLICQPCRR